MTSKEFTLWLKGFTTACNEYSPTPKQWDTIKEELDKVTDEPKIGTPIGEGGWGTPNVTPITPVWQHPHYVDPYNPYKITGRGPETPTGTTITTTPGTGYITIANPYIASFTSSGSYNPSTSTTYGYPSGSAWSYTTYQPFSTQDANSLKPTKQTKFKKRKAKSVKEWEDEIDLGGEE